MKNIVENSLKARAKILSMKDFPTLKKQIRSVTVVDVETGEILKESVGYVPLKNGSGFVISYTEKMCEFISKVESPTVIRLFMLLAHRQGYGVDGLYGYRCSKKYLREFLHVNRKTVYDALEYLKSNFLVVENRFDGQLEFMVNPDYITVGRDKAARMREWSRRWDWYFKKKDS